MGDSQTNENNVQFRDSITIKRRSLNTQFEKDKYQEIGYSEMNKKSIIALAILLAVAYGINMSMAGVAVPGCVEGVP